MPLMHPFTLNISGRVVEFRRPQVMGILNVTPDSFYSGSRTMNGAAFDADAVYKAAQARVQVMLSEGVDIIDVGGCSTRPGSAEVSAQEEMRRVEVAVRAVRDLDRDIPVSVDTWRAEVARKAVEEWGADIVNDISGGIMDPDMIPVVASLRVPYILMHMRGTPADMQQLTFYPRGVVADVAAEMHAAVVRATQAGVADIILDPGFGFAKTVEQNYELLRRLPELSMLLDNRPMLVGLSRKSMIYKPLGIKPAEALAGTTALNALALDGGAAILRVHDVADARQTVDVWQLFNSSNLSSHD